MMLPDARRKEFPAIEEDAGHADSCVLTRPPDWLPRAALLRQRRLLPAVLPANPAGGRAARSTFSQIWRTLKKCSA